MPFKNFKAPVDSPETHPPIWILILIPVVVFAVYASTLNPSLFRNDSPETITACIALGVSHPPSYPFHTLLGRLFSFVPLGNPAMGINFFSSFLGALGAFLFALNLWIFLPTVQKGKKNPGLPLILACLTSSLCFAFSKSYWSSSLAAKGSVYIFQIVLELGLMLCLQSGTSSPQKRITTSNFIFFTVFIFSLGVVNHWPTHLLLIPAIGLVTIARPYTPRTSNVPPNLPWKRVLVALTLSVFVLSLYLYLPLRSHLRPHLDFGEPSSFQRFFSSLFRTDYFKRETLASFMPTALSTIQEKSIYISARFKTEFNALFSLLSFAGVFGLWRRGFKKELFFLLLVLFTTVIANLLFLKVEPIEYWHMDDHMLTANWVTALLASIGVYYLFTILDDRGSLQYFFWGLFALLPVLTYQKNIPFNNQTREFLFRGFGIEALKSMDQNAYYFAESDYDYFSILYLKEVEHRRYDVRLALTTFLTTEQMKRWGHGLSSGHISNVRPFYCAFPNGPFINGCLQYASGISFKPSGTLVELNPPKSDNGNETIQPLEELWQRYLAPERRSIDPINGLFLELCAHPYLNMADFLKLRQDMAYWDLYYLRALSLIQDPRWKAETWANKAEGDLILGNSQLAVQDYLYSREEYERLGLMDQVHEMLQRALKLDPSLGQVTETKDLK